MWREDVFWSDVEQAAGVYGFTPTGSARSQEIFAGLVQRDAQNYPINFQAILGYANAGVYTTDATSATWRNNFANYAAEVVSQLTTRGYSNFGVQLWNEANTTVFATIYNDLAEVPDLAALAQAAYPAIKAVNSNCDVLLGGVLDPDWTGGYVTWLQTLLDQSGIADACDGICLNRYFKSTPPVPTPEEHWLKLDDIAKHCLDELGSSKKVLVSETGYFNGSATGFITEAAAALYYSRYPFLLRAIPIAGASFYDLRNDGTNAAVEGENYGFATSALVDKQQAATVRAALAHVHAATAAKCYTNGSLYAVKMTVSGGERLAIWRPDGTAENISIKVSSAGSGTLSVETIGSTTATQAIVAGIQFSTPIALGTTAKVLHADVGITFPEFV